MNQRDYGISLKAVVYSKNIPVPAWKLREKIASCSFILNIKSQASPHCFYKSEHQHSVIKEKKNWTNEMVSLGQYRQLLPSPMAWIRSLTPIWGYG